MPTKDLELLGGTLYLNNEPIMQLNKCDLVCEQQASDEFTVTEPKPINIDWGKEITFTVQNVQINRNKLLSLIHGRKITNNWLKMHGGVMTRRK